MKKFWILLLFCMSTFADDFNPRIDVISDNYEAGPFLIYDCREKHWVCVRELFYKNCEEKRAGSYDDILPCAPIGKFPTKQSCFQRVLFLTTHNHGNRFCIKESLRTKAFSFD